MADATYQPKVYTKQGGDELVIASGGILNIETGGILKSNGTQASAITDASEAHDLNSTFSDTEAEAALDALGGTVNEILAALRGVGIIASS